MSKILSMINGFRSPASIPLTLHSISSAKAIWGCEGLKSGAEFWRLLWECWEIMDFWEIGSQPSTTFVSARGRSGSGKLEQPGLRMWPGWHLQFTWQTQFLGEAGVISTPRWSTLPSQIRLTKIKPSSPENRLRQVEVMLNLDQTKFAVFKLPCDYILPTMTVHWSICLSSEQASFIPDEVGSIRRE